MGIPFRVVPPEYEVDVKTDDPIEKVELKALEKSRLVARQFTDGLVVGADTVVAIDGTILGKPRNEDEARNYLRILSGRVHKVITGVAIIDASSMREIVDHCVTRVKFRDLSDSEINYYVRSGEPYDKAGGYAIQGIASFFVDYIEGDFWNVVGFPIPLFYRILKEKFDIDLLHYICPRFSLV